MVFFKLTMRIHAFIKLANISKLIGCSRFCDRQLISYEDLTLLTEVLNQNLKKLVEEYSQENNEIEETQSKTMEDSPLKDKQSKTIGEDIQEIEKPFLMRIIQELQALEKEGKPLLLNDIVKDAYPLYINEHYCNENLKGSNVTDIDIKSNPTKPNYPTISEEEVKREKKNFEIEFQKIKRRREDREYERLTKNISFSEKGLQISEDIKKMNNSMSLAVNFIMSFLLSFAVGFYLGKYILQYDSTMSLILGIIITVLTLFVEGFLFIVKDQQEQNNKKLRKKYNPEPHIKFE